MNIYAFRTIGIVVAIIGVGLFVLFPSASAAQGVCSLAGSDGSLCQTANYCCGDSVCNDNGYCAQGACMTSSSVSHVDACECGCAFGACKACPPSCTYEYIEQCEPEYCPYGGDRQRCLWFEQNTDCSVDSGVTYSGSCYPAPSCNGYIEQCEPEYCPYGGDRQRCLWFAEGPPNPGSNQCTVDSGLYYTGSCNSAPPPPPPPPSNSAPIVSGTTLSISQASIHPCTTSVLFSWTFSDAEDGSNQSGYQLQVDEEVAFLSPAFDSDNASSSTQQRYLGIGSDIAFDESYWWRVRVRDSSGAWSSWSPVDSFQTPAHAAPSISFSWQPAAPSGGEPVQFSDSSEAAGDAIVNGWSWQFTGAQPESSTQQNPTVVFSGGVGQASAMLSVSDSDGFSCSLTQQVDVGLPLPDYNEVPPVAGLADFLYRIVEVWSRAFDGLASR